MDRGHFPTQSLTSLNSERQPLRTHWQLTPFLPTPQTCAHSCFSPSGLWLLPTRPHTELRRSRAFPLQFGGSPGPSLSPPPRGRASLSVPRLCPQGGALAASTPPGSARKCHIRPCFCLSSQGLFSFKTKDRVFSIWSPRGQMGHGSEPSQVTESVSVAPQTAPRRASRGRDPGPEEVSCISAPGTREEPGVWGLGRVLTWTTQAGALGSTSLWHPCFPAEVRELTGPVETCGRRTRDPQLCLPRLSSLR